MCKTKRVSLFKHGIFRNLITLYGMFITIPVLILGESAGVS